MFAEGRARLLEVCGRLDQSLKVGLSDPTRHDELSWQVIRDGEMLVASLAMMREPKPEIRKLRLMLRLMGGTEGGLCRQLSWDSLGLENTAAPEIMEGVVEATLKHQRSTLTLAPPQQVFDWAIASIDQIQEKFERLSAQDIEQRCDSGFLQIRRRLRKRLKQAAREADDSSFVALQKTMAVWFGSSDLFQLNQTIVDGSKLLPLAERLDEEQQFAELARWLLSLGFTSATVPRVWKRLPKLRSRARRKSLATIRRDVLPR